MMRFRGWRTIVSVVLILLSAAVWADRLKDLSQVQGVRQNQLIGYGLVVGLNGTGDSAPFTNQTFRNMMHRFGITLPSNINPKLKNVAAVAVHAKLPPFYKPGQDIDITVDSLGNAKSLRGGSLLMTPLKGADGKIYAMAQGNLVVGGFSAGSQNGGSSVTVNVPSVGRIPNGATVERSVPNPLDHGDTITFDLNQPDFTTAHRVVKAINNLLGQGTAYAEDAGSVKVKAPRDPSQRVSFLSILQNINVKPAQGAAKVVINSRTGTIVVGQNVKVSPAAVTHGNLTVTISSNPQVSQPNALSQGKTTVTPNTNVSANEENAHMFKFGPTATLNDIVQAVNQVGAKPSDVMAILEALKKAGALRANLIVI